MDRFFEKISFKQFKKDISNSRKEYLEYVLPKRATKNSCGYDFFAIHDISISPGEIVKVPTGYKAKFLDDEVLFLIVRSSLGIKMKVRMCNQVGVVDADYYNNIDNEGHLFAFLQNYGKEEVVIKKGTAYLQGIFLKYLTCGDVSLDDRVSGIGSTNK